MLLAAPLMNTHFGQKFSSLRVWVSLVSFVRFVLISFTSYSFHQTHPAMMTIPPNDMHALQCCQIRITKSDQLLIKLLAIISHLRWYICWRKGSNVDNPLTEVIHILQTSVDRPSLDDLSTPDFPFLPTIHFEIYDDLLLLFTQASAVAKQNISWSFLFSYFLFVINSEFGLRWHRNSSRRTPFGQAQHFRYTTSGRFHFSYSTNIPWTWWHFLLVHLTPQCGNRRHTL